MAITKEEIEQYNAQIQRMEDVRKQELDIARKDAEIQSLTSSLRYAEEQIKKLTEFKISGQMLKLIEKHCEDNEGLREQWTDFLMTLKLTVPDIEEQLNDIKKNWWLNI